ncbi:MAG: twin-arginine translocase subunit TatC, partial [Verrucomicrobiota bacterium]
MSQSDPQHDDPYVPAEALPPRPTREKPMGFWEHLEELRGVIIRSVIVFVICAAVIGYFITEFNELLMWPLLTVQKDYPSFVVDLGTQKIMEVFTMIIQVCVLGGLVV